MNLQNIFFHCIWIFCVLVIAPRAPIALFVVGRPCDNTVDTRVRQRIKVAVRRILIALAIGLCSVFVDAFDGNRIHSARTRIGGVEIHIHVKQNVVHCKQYAVAELDVVFNGKVIIGVIIAVIVSLHQVFIACRDYRIVKRHARFVPARVRLSVLIARKHAYLRLTYYFAVRARSVEKRIEHAV